MMVERKCDRFLLTVATIAGVVTWSPHAVADDRLSLQTTNTTPVKENRIAVVWRAIPPASKDAAP